MLVMGVGYGGGGGSFLEEVDATTVGLLAPYTALQLAGGTVTASAPVLALTQTWNNAAATFKAMTIAVTSTGALQGSLLMEATWGGVTKFSVRHDSGRLVCGSVSVVDQGYSEYSFQAGATNNAFRADSAGVAIHGGFGGLRVGSNKGLTWSQNTGWYNTGDTGVMRNAAGVVEINNGTAGDYRDLTLRTLLAGAGATITADTPAINLTQTWNSGAVTFTALKVNVTNTASATASMLMDLQVGGSSLFKVEKDGRAAITTLYPIGQPSSWYDIKYGYNSWLFRAYAQDVLDLSGQTLAVKTQATFVFGWVSGSSLSGVSADTGLGRNAAGIVEINNGTKGTLRDLTMRNIDITGTIKGGTHTAIGAETVTGYITITDAGGTSRKVAVVS